MLPSAAGFAVNMRKVKYIQKTMNYDVTIELIYTHSDKRNNK